MFAIIILGATLVGGYSLSSWYSASPAAVVVPPKVQEENKEQKTPDMTSKVSFREELKQRVEADYVRREHLRTALELKFRNALPVIQ